MKNEKDPFKLTSIDEHGGHIHIIPAEVKGFFRRQRSRVQGILLVIFLVIPWIHIHGKPLFLINVPNREFTFLGVLFRSHDAPLIFLLLAVLTLSLAFVTAIWGRIWCGWACPQTVFIEAVYRRIEIWAEGNYIQRRALQDSDLSFSKLARKAAKWFGFILVSSLISHSFIAYFTGSTELLQMIQGSPDENWSYFVLVTAFTAILVFNFGWFREQFCVIMCPYGRIQSVLLEPTSLAVAYDSQRGEPRRGTSKETPAGDCISCNRCVEVCPTGIDIRNGLQMECIGCTSCIDACNEIMKKVNKPQNLIRYQTINGSSFRIWNLKTVAMGFLILLFSIIFIYNIGTRNPVNVAFLRGIDTPYSEDRDAQGNVQVLNHFRIHLTSQTDKDISYSIDLAESSKSSGFKLTLAQNPILLKSKDSQTGHLFIHLPQNLLPSTGKKEFQILVKSEDGFVSTQNLIFLGPHP